MKVYRLFRHKKYGEPIEEKLTENAAEKDEIHT